MDLIAEKAKTMICETYDYKGFHFQRMNKDQMWYVTFDNKIVNWGQYRNDLEEWCEDALKQKQNA